MNIRRFSILLFLSTLVACASTTSGKIENNQYHTFDSAIHFTPPQLAGLKRTDGIEASQLPGGYIGWVDFSGNIKGSVQFSTEWENISYAPVQSNERFYKRANKFLSWYLVNDYKKRFAVPFTYGTPKVEELVINEKPALRATLQGTIGPNTPTVAVITLIGLNDFFVNSQVIFEADSHTLDDVESHKMWKAYWDLVRSVETQAL
ncbi:hypothetical protein LRP49_03595 [Enterovibrio sp. ZSDZ35]|uniref:Lipoprotein n=1 Tax=Enterovibrio qingdaonensis TaxID=2899818 RepID=A0ABT5QH42_9GAMM|nr:hypothetical protein [Enterovibrio sp. ZSDZ35]MDD1780277.1 hypothetical protein [Enterovibrio sp. ZSDZ35]